MNASLHNTDGNTVTVKDFGKSKEGNHFSTVTVSDSEGNYVSLFFQNLAEVLNFALQIESQTHRLVHKESNEIIERVFSRK